MGFISKTKSTRAPSQQQRQVSSLPKRSPWHAVSIVPGKDACPAVKELGRKRWLSAEAPRLPIPGCTASRCDCRYKHHADRRSGPRRSVDREGQGLARHYDGAERRSGRRDRRKD